MPENDETAQMIWPRTIEGIHQSLIVGKLNKRDAAILEKKTRKRAHIREEIQHESSEKTTNNNT